MKRVRDPVTTKEIQSWRGDESMAKSNVRIRVWFALPFMFLCVSFLAGLGGSRAAMASKPVATFALPAFPVTLVPVVTSLSGPLYVTNAHDGSNRLFFVEQSGMIKVVQPGSLTPTVFLNISAKVHNSGEQGLLGLAFHPQFSTNRRFFVHYTRTDGLANVIAEYKASVANPNVADTTETLLLSIDQPFSNHNGGSIEFGPDTFLYIGKGDGGSGNDPGNRAQNIDLLLGKILRIDVDHPNGAVPYSSPATNPFFGATAGSDEIYAVGMRNPFRFSFDRTTGQLYVGDVGQGVREEVDIVTNGGNYGWRVFEGTLCTGLGPAACIPANFTPPITEYSHTPEVSGRCAILGGYVYRGTASTLPTGAYVFGDLCTGEIFMLNAGVQSLLFDTNLTISSFGEDEAGELYVVELANTVFRIAHGTGGSDSIGLFSPTPSAFFLRNTNSTGTANDTFNYGAPSSGMISMSGNWNGDGVDTVGLYNTASGAFFLRDSDTSGSADVTFNFGPGGLGWMPLAGDWNGDSTDTVGLYNPATSTFFLKNSNTSGIADMQFAYGPGGVGLVPIVGDWNGDGVDTVGLYNPATGAFFLRNSNTTGIADITFSYGPGGTGLIPIVGDWDGDGDQTPGLYNPATGAFFLRNSNTTGSADITFAYGPGGAGWKVLAGDWNGL